MQWTVLEVPYLNYNLLCRYHGSHMIFILFSYVTFRSLETKYILPN